jgi:nicotinamide-nucleotide amidase
VGRELEERGLTVAVMESCTGGLLASMITDVAGSSTYFQGGIVAYSAEAKRQYGVEASVLSTYGLYSPETACAMAGAARREFGADVGLGVTGIAGTEELEDKQPGTVFIAVQAGEDGSVREIRRPGRRQDVKHWAALSTLDLARRHLIRAERATT